MFSILVFDKLKKEITLVTDHFGQKQLYYYLDKNNNVRAISSEIKPLLEIYKVTEQKINYGRREIEGGIEKNPQD